MKKRLIIIVLLVVGVGIISAWVSKSNQNLGQKRSKQMKLTSPVFNQEEQIPEEYTCDDANISPPLTVADVPGKARSLVLTVDDPDAPAGTWTHWLVWNIDPNTQEILEDTTPDEGVVGVNDFKKVEYGGPCPPSGTHRYVFKVYALDVMLDLEEGADRGELEEAMEDHVLDSAELVGLYTSDQKVS